MTGVDDFIMFMDSDSVDNKLVHIHLQPDNIDKIQVNKMRWTADDRRIQLIDFWLSHTTAKKWIIYGTSVVWSAEL
jgi:hypothetical protein